MQMEQQELRVSRKGTPIKMELPIEGTVPVSDTKPDVAEILDVAGHAVLDKAECENGRLTVSGRVLYTVLYRPEDSDCVLSAMSGTLSFSRAETVEGWEEHTPVHFFCTAPFLDATALNSRKIAIKAVTEVTAEPYFNESYTVLSANSEGLCAKTVAAKGYSLVLEEQGRIHLSGQCTVPGGELPIKELLLAEAKVQEYSVKVVENKAIVKGSVLLSFLYQPEDSLSPTAFSELLELTELFDLPGLSPEQEYRFDLRVEEFSAEPVMGEGDRFFEIHTDISLLFSALAVETECFTLVKDGFVPGKETIEVSEALSLQALLPIHQVPLSLHERMTVAEDLPPISRVLRLTAEPSLEPCGTHVRIDVLLKLLYQDINGDVHLATKLISHTPEEEINEKAVFEGTVRLPSPEYILISDMVLEVRLELVCEIGGVLNQSLTVLQSMDVTENAKKRPSVVICFVGETDTLWSLSKRYKIPETEILSVNALFETAELQVGQRLLIPNHHGE